MLKQVSDSYAAFQQRVKRIIPFGSLAIAIFAGASFRSVAISAKIAVMSCWCVQSGGYWQRL